MNTEFDVTSTDLSSTKSYSQEDLDGSAPEIFDISKFSAMMLEAEAEEKVGRSMSAAAELLGSRGPAVDINLEMFGDLASI